MPWSGNKSYRQLIRDNVVATLAGITVANGFELDVAEVCDEQRDIENDLVNKKVPSAIPLHQVLAGDEETASAASGGLVEATFTLIDHLVVLADDVERAIADTKKAMWADRRRGLHPSGKTLANDTRIPSITTLRGVIYPHELVRFEFEIDYTHFESAP